MTSGARSKKFHDIGILTQARLAISQIRVRARPTLKAVRSGSDRQLARYHRIPAIYYERLFTTVGGLVSYGSRCAESNHQAGAYVGRILGGEKPGESAGGAADQVRVHHQPQDRGRCGCRLCDA